jgi:hypothetical protein
MYTISGIMYISGRGPVATTAFLRHKHVRIDQAKLTRARKVLAAETETEALDRALTLVVTEADIDAVLRRNRGKGTLRKVFR